MSYTGVYDKTIYYNPVSKYCVISVKTNDQTVPQKARSAFQHRDRLIRFTAVGYELPQTDRVSMILDGEWQDGKYGQQLQVESFEEIVPQTRDGVRGYLSSRLIKGVGEKTADLIVERFGADALRILEKEPERLLEIRGITPSKLEEIKASYDESRCLRGLMILLSPFNVTPATATKIYEHFGAKSVDILQKNPFELCQISGFGFKRVDAIVRKGNCKLNDPMRIHGAIYAALDTGRNENGHLYLELETLIKESSRLLNDRLANDQVRVTNEEIVAVLEDMVLKGEVVSNKNRVYQTTAFVQEDETAVNISKMLAAPPDAVDITSILESIRQNLGMALSQRQSEAVYMAFRSNLSIITGSPGTGKTTVLRAIIEVFARLYPSKKIMLAAPTGRASRRMAESTGRNDAKTLHSVLGLLGDSGYVKDKKKEPLDADLIIVDESSMIDMWLANHFFSRIRPGAKVILVGDVDQLQSVGAGDVFRELINCGRIPVTVLNEIFRQKQDSLIAHNAKAINEDSTNLYYGDDFLFLKCKTQEEAADIICTQFCDLVKKFGIEKVQILSPFRAEGLAAVEQLNRTIRELVNPPEDEDIPDLKIGSRYFRVGDKDNHLFQSRLYPNGSDEFSEQNRSLVHKILSTCLGVPNLWVLKTKREDLGCVESAEESAQYPDYDYQGNLSFIKGSTEKPQMIIGKKPICVCCGLPFNAHRSIKCGCSEMVVCQDCGQTLPRQQTRYVEGAFHCNACLHICAACGRICRDTMYPAYDRKGRLIEVCQECFTASQEPCFACSVRNVCAIIGNTLCHHAAIHPVGTEVT